MQEWHGGGAAAGYMDAIGVMVERRTLHVAFFLDSGEQESFDLLGMCLHHWLNFLRAPCRRLGLLLLTTTICPIDNMQLCQ
jgi:hypothetical protein